MNRHEKEKWVAKQLIDEMFLIAGHPDVTYEDVIGRKDSWWLDWGMTLEQNEQWKQAGIKILQREYRWPKYRAVKEMDMVSFLYGLKFIDYETDTQI
jgi:hypothetical protein